MTTEEIAALKLSPAMRTALMCTEPADLMKPGGTRAALMRRNLVHSRKSRPDRFGRLAPAGLAVRAALRAQEGW